MTVPVPTPTPDARAEMIFSKTRAAFAARVFPATISYSVRVSGLRNGTWTGRSYQSFEHSPSGRITVHLMSDEDNANPLKPKGINIAIGAMRVSGDEQPDILGVPRLAPTYAFGLLGGLPRRQAEEADATPSPQGGLRTIGVVATSERNYDVRLLGEENVDGTIAWHLRLTPLGNPGKYRVRDLWVEEKDYQTIRLRTYGDFTAKETGAGYWTVAFTQIDGSWYIASETSNNAVQCADGVYEHISVQFTGVAADPQEVLDFTVHAPADEDEPELTEP